MEMRVGSRCSVWGVISRELKPGHSFLVYMYGLKSVLFTLA
jgi:hypothetical protein